MVATALPSCSYGVIIQSIQTIIHSPLYTLHYTMSILPRPGGAGGGGCRSTHVPNTITPAIPSPLAPYTHLFVRTLCVAALNPLRPSFMNIKIFLQWRIATGTRSKIWNGGACERKPWNAKKIFIQERGNAETQRKNSGTWAMHAGRKAIQERATISAKWTRWRVRFAKFLQQYPSLPPKNAQLMGG